MNIPINPKAKIEVLSVPFPHFIIDDLFLEREYRAFCDEFNRELSLGLSSEEDPKRFSPYRDNFYFLTVDPSSENSPLASLLYSIDWKNYCHSFFPCALDQNTIAEFRHHPKRSQDGRIHTDQHLVSFESTPLPNGINPWYFQVPYFSDKGSIRTLPKISLLYYLNNPIWVPGQGGETGLMARDGEELKVVSRVAPINNRLFIFEVSDRSFHGFLSNPFSARNSILQAFHIPPETSP